MSQKYNPFLNTKSPRSMDTPLENTAVPTAVFLLEDIFLFIIYSLSMMRRLEPQKKVGD